MRLCGSFASIRSMPTDGRQGMLDHCTQLAEANIPFIFDPGQGLPMFNGEELLNHLALAMKEFQTRQRRYLLM